MLTFGPKFNRSYGMYYNFANKYITLDIFFNKANSFVAFRHCPIIQSLKDNDKCVYYMYRDISHSSFAKNCLDITNIQTTGLDIKNQFNNVRSDYQSKIQYVNNETIKLNKITNPKDPHKVFESNLYIYTFTFSDYPFEFLYVLAERQHIDINVNKKIVRTAAFQICTKTCLNDLTSIISPSREEQDSDIDTVQLDTYLK